MAAPAASAHRSGSGGGSVRGLALTLVLVLAAGAVVLHRSKRPLRAHSFARDFYANLKPDMPSPSPAHHLGRDFCSGIIGHDALPEVKGEPRKGRTPAEEQLWMHLHEVYVQEVKQLEKTGLDLVFYGDSITEAMRGTTLGVPNQKHAGTPAVVQKHYGHLRTAALSLAGDTTLNLLWRVQNGEGPTFSPKIAVVLIGTNDLTNPIYQLDLDNPSATGAIVAAGAVSAVRAMLEQNMRMHVILLAITPRGERFALASFTDKFKQPSRVSPAIAAANAHLKGFAETQDRVTYVDCSPVLLEKVGANKVQIDPVLMPDSLHPNAKGMDAFLGCLDLHLKPYLPIKSLRRI